MNILRLKARYMASLGTLCRVSGGVWCLGLGAYIAIVERYQYFFRNSEFVTETMGVLDKYPHKQKCLGSNIKRLRFDLGDDFNKMNDYLAQVVIPVSGSKQKGKLYSWSSKQHDPENDTYKWRVDRVDLMLHKQDPFTFYRHPDADYVQDIKLKEWQIIRDR